MLGFLTTGAASLENRRKSRRADSRVRKSSLPRPWCLWLSGRTYPIERNRATPDAIVSYL